MSDLRRLIAEATVLAGGEHPCHILGHRWALYGGRHCGCEIGSCSVPVYRCDGCGDFDYGENQEAEDTYEACQLSATGAEGGGDE